MTCAEARDAMLVADLSELTGDRGDLAEHLAICPRCRALAAAIVQDSARLASAARRRARSRRSRRMLIATTLPIAAGLAGVASLRFLGAPSAPAPVGAARTALPVARRVSLTVERGQTATVLKTADPSVTVIWLSPGVGQ
jgi:hypothetical protein